MKTLAGAPLALFQRLSNTYAFVRNPARALASGAAVASGAGKD